VKVVCRRVCVTPFALDDPLELLGVRERLLDEPHRRHLRRACGIEAIRRVLFCLGSMLFCLRGCSAYTNKTNTPRKQKSARHKPKNQHGTTTYICAGQYLQGVLDLLIEEHAVANNAPRALHSRDVDRSATSHGRDSRGTHQVAR
jgi:hypothetical protein